MDQIKEFLAPYWANEWLQRLVALILALVVLLSILNFVRKRILKHTTDTDDRYRVLKVTTIIRYALILIVFLFVFNDKLGNIGVTLGVASAGIAFALQEVIVSVAGWLNIITSQQVKVGQRVKIGEITGDIIDIGIMKTTVMEIGGWVDGDLYNGRITEISNNFVFSTPIQNYSEHYPFLWDEISVPIRTDSDFKEARRKFVEIVEDICGDYAEASVDTWAAMQGRFMLENASVKPSVTLRFDENWITFTLRYVVDYERRRSTKDKLYTRILEEIRYNPDIIMIASVSMEVTNIVKEP
jgi:small-conductance mechanosensitive channel